MHRIAMAQINSTVGDLEGNSRRIVERVAQARALHADIVAFPELAVTGYPPEDLLLKPGFIRANRKALNQIAQACQDITAIVGFVDADDADIYNAAAVIHDGKLAGVHHKIFLPNYGVFDEDRYFSRGKRVQVFSTDGLIFGVGVCEDLWYPDGPAHLQALMGNAHLVVNINASPYYVGKWVFREQMLATRAADNTCFVAYLNTVGGQDELVYDGQSLLVDSAGQTLFRGRAFEEQLIVQDLEIVSPTFRRRLHDPRRRKRFGELVSFPDVDVVALSPLSHRGARPPLPEQTSATPPERWEEIYRALVTGVRDYVEKNGFKKVVIGLSGGIDSALTAAVARDALGSDRVTGVAMPSVYNLSASLEDAKELAERLNIEFMVVPIAQPFEAYKSTLKDVFAGRPEDVTEENLQARIRGNILMAVSNKFGHLVLTTGNKSEMAVGYCTLYGDMAGGFAVIKDVPKTWVYELAKWRNRDREVIPDRTITRPPSAELRPDQTDQDSLPPYEILDPILQRYVEHDESIAQIVEAGFDESVVRKVITLVDRNEYKRRQGAPGIKITPRAFGKDRRLPITNRYRD